MALHALYPAEPTWNGAVIVGCADDSEGYGACDDGAVYLCCTFPEVAFGGRYPLSLPCGARTFLTTGLSAWPRDCLSYSPVYFTGIRRDCQRPEKKPRKGSGVVVIFPELRYNFHIC